MKKLSLCWLIPIAAWVYAAIASPYPYHATWDSSQVYTLDAMIAGAGQVPDHLFHPNMVPLVLYRHVFLPLGKLFGWISISSITELEAASNPYLAFAETAQYLIQLGVLFALVFLTFTYLTVFELLRPQLDALRGRAAWLLAVTLAAVALASRNAPFMLVWVRHETIGIALWSVATYCTVRAARAPTARRFVVLAGLFSGAAVLSKVQLIGGVAVLPFLYGFLLAEAPPPPTVRERRATVALAFVVLASIAAVHALAYVAFTHGELPRVAFDKFLRAKHFVPIAPACAALFFAAVAVAMRRANAWPRAAAIAARLTLFAASFTAVLALALLLGTTWRDRSGALYLTYIYSFMFGQLSQGAATGYIKPIVWSRLAAVFAVFGAVLAAVAVGHVRSRGRLPRARLVAGIAAVSVAVLAAAVLLRPSPRKDGLLLDAWLLLAALVAWRLLLALYSERRVLLVGGAIAWLAVGFQVVGLSRFHEASYAAGAYDYSVTRWKEFSYGFRGKPYRAIMRRAYPTEAAWLSAFRWAGEDAELELLFDQVFGGAGPKLGDTALAFEGARIGADRDWKITAISPELSGALLVPLRAGAVRLGVRADLDFYLLSAAAPRLASPKAARATSIALEARRDGAIEPVRWSVLSLAPGALSAEVGEGATIAIRHRDGRAGERPGLRGGRR
jgi:hypothetical protein